MDARQLYATVYRVCQQAANAPDCPAVDGHRRFALRLPRPGVKSEQTEAVLSAMVSVSPSNDSALEGFYQSKVEPPQKVGDLLRQNLDSSHYLDNMEEIAKRY